jgi:hypothetical protein
MVRKVIFLALTFLLPASALLFFSRHLVIAATAYLGCKPASLVVKTNQTFYITVAVTETTDLFAWQFDADYNENYLEFMSIVPGNHLCSDGASHYYVQPYDTGSEAQRAAATRLSQHQGVDGSGKIAHIFFRAIQQNTGGSNVVLNATTLVDRNALGISKTLYKSGNCKVLILDGADELIQPLVGELVYLPVIIR